MTVPDSASPLHDAFEHQDEIFARAFAVIMEAIAQRAFPAASIAITHRGNLIALKAFGTPTYHAPSGKLASGAPFLAHFARPGDFQQGAPSFSRSMPEGGDFDFDITPTSLFDLASLTKVVATTTMAMLLYERGLLDLDAPVSAVVPEFTAKAAKDPRRQEVTLRLLLAHASGLPAYEKLFLQARTRDELLRAALTMPLAADPGTVAAYSDIGFLTLGVALERLADESLDRFCQREVFASLGMTNTTFNPPKEIRAQIPPTADERVQEEPRGADTPFDKLRAGSFRETPKPELPRSAGQQGPRSTFRRRIIQGEVQDENASVLGGVAPHAGLFSTASDIARFAHSMLNGGRPILRPETVELFTRRASIPESSSRTLGWDTPSTRSLSGKYFSPGSYGHVGYTGTSLWLDPARQLSVTLLTNRTWPDCSNQAINTIRPKFHDAIIEALKSPSQVQ